MKRWWHPPTKSRRRQAAIWGVCQFPCGLGGCQFSYIVVWGGCQFPCLVVVLSILLLGCLQFAKAMSAAKHRQDELEANKKMAEEVRGGREGPCVQCKAGKGGREGATGGGGAAGQKEGGGQRTKKRRWRMGLPALPSLWVGGGDGRMFSGSLHCPPSSRMATRATGDKRPMSASGKPLSECPFLRGPAAGGG